METGWFQRFLQGVVLAASMPMCAVAASTTVPLAGEAGIQGGEVVRLTVPPVDGDLVFRFTEYAIDLQLRWAFDGQTHQANAPGKRFGDQLLWLPVGSRPEFLELRPTVPDAPAGQLTWSFMPADQAGEVLAQQARAESQANALADEGSSASEEAALRIYGELVEAERRSRSARHTVLLYRAGQMAARMDRWADAESYYRAGLADLERAPAPGHLLQALAYVLFKQARHDEALDYFDQALSRLEAEGDRYEVALANNNRCLVFHAQGDMAAAAACLSRAEQSYARAGIVGYRGVVLINLAAAYSALGRHDEARLAFASARELIQQLPAEESRRLQAGLDLHEAWAALAAGRYRDALASGLAGQAKAEQVRNSGMWGQLIRATASALLGLGQTQRAREQIETLLASPELMASVIDPARLSLAAARLEPRLERRAEKMLEVMQAASAARDDLTYLRAWIDYAHAQHRLGGDESAVNAARGVLAMARQMQLAEVEIDALTLISESVGPVEGLQMQHDALALATKAGRTEDQFMLWSAQARQYQRLADWAAARSAVERADAAFLQLRAQLSSEEYAGLRDRLLPLATGRLAAGMLDPSLDNEGRVQWIWGRLASSRHWASSPGAARLEANQDLRQLLVPSRQGGPVGAAELRQLEAQRFALEKSDRRQPDGLWPDWQRVQAALRPGEMLLVLIADDPVSAALVLQADAAQVLTLGAGSELQQGLAHLIRGLGRQDPLGQGALRARVAHLSGLLGQLPAQLAGAAQVSYLPGPGLEALPLELLLQRPTARLVRLSPVSLTESELGMGWPDLDPERVLVLQAEIAGPAVPDGLGEWSDLPATGDEVQHLLRFLPAGAPQVHRGRSAAAAMLSQSASSAFDLVHVAGHAFSNDYWSALDELAFGPAADARVALGTLRRQPWRAELVVLGACRTAYGAEGDLGLGFAQGFLQAGAKRVLASGWPVDDRGTAAFMDHFYAALLSEARDPAAALAAAQALMRADPRWADPYWWAGYQLWQPTPTGSVRQLAGSH